MKKTLFRLLALVCLVCVFLCACGSKEITADEAVAIMMEDLGDDAANIGDPHVHEGIFDNQTCYSIYITLNGESWVYMISADGEIIANGPGGHSH